MEILLTLVVGTLCIVCFFVGAKVGQQVSRGETIETPELNPVKIIQTHKEAKTVAAEQSKYEKVMRNIDNYNGSELGQEDI